MKMLYALLCLATTAMKAQNIDDSIKLKMKEGGFVGVGAAILVNKKVVWAKGYGYADKDKMIPFTPNTIMNIASISKTFTAVCIMRAVEEGKLLLDEDINIYLPFKVVNPYFPAKKITVRNLANHTASIVDRSPIYDSSYYYGGDSPTPLGDFLKEYFDTTGKYYSKTNFLNAKPGTKNEYSNIGAGLAGYIVERVTGKKLNDYSKDVIFKPLHMDNSGWFISEINRTKHSKLYIKNGHATDSIALYGLTTYPDGGVRTSIKELSVYLTWMLMNLQTNKPQVLTQKSTKEMTINQIFWDNADNGEKVGHSGGDPGIGTEMYYYPLKNVGVILFVNTDVNQSNHQSYSDLYMQLYNYALELKSKSVYNR